MTTADFQLGAYLSTYVFNDNMYGADVLQSKGKELMMLHPEIMAYWTRFSTEMASYLEKRPDAPL